MTFLLYKNYHIIFLADRWFPNTDVLSYINSIGCFYCIRSKSYFKISYYNSKNKLITKSLRDIVPFKYHSRIFYNALYIMKQYPTNVVVSCSSNTNDPWYLITNDDPSQAIKNYSYRLGSIESIFKSQKSNGFRLESTNTQKIEHFISLFTIVCIALLCLTIIGVDYSKNKAHSKIKIRDVQKHANSTNTRKLSFFNFGLTIFNLCYYNSVPFTLKFNFMLYDV